MKRLLISLALIALALLWNSCKDAPQGRSERIQQMIAQSKLASDPHSWSKPNEARVTHLAWKAKVDMKAHVIQATATYQVKNLTQATDVIFDIRKLDIQNVEVNGKPVEFTVGEDKKFIGQPLVIPIPEDSCEVKITYSTSPDADALLWVDGDKPFLFSQSQAILARTWLPCQDSPGVRFTYSAEVTVPNDLLALMSAENPQQKNTSGIYSFKMEQPVPSYLMALAVGDVEFRSIGPRTGVYAVRDVVDGAAKEFEDIEAMITAAEKLYGPYVWGRYDLLVLPAAFPFGGMENPRLTFATPTILAGDKSLVSLVAHELAHSWSGNLVTNSTWNDFWLNEGFTVYFEMRIMEEVFGKERSEMLALLARQDLDATLGVISADDSHLKLKLDDRDPDEGMSDIAYNKGYFFLRTIEEKVGRERFDAFLKNYFTSNAFQVMDTERFVSVLRKDLLSEEEFVSIGVEGWIYGPGLPANTAVVNSDRMTKVDEMAAQWTKLKDSSLIKWSSWSYQEKYRFLSSITDFTSKDMATLDAKFSISASTNSEVLFKWLELSISKKYEPAYSKVEEFLMSVGRRKFVMPLFEAMVVSDQKDMALRIYEKSRPNYHSVTTQSVDELLGINQN